MTSPSFHKEAREILGIKEWDVWGTKKEHDLAEALQSAYNRAILDAARLAENECEYDLADSICQLKQESR